MDERTALDRIADGLGAAGDDAAVIDGLVLSTDMLHATTDFPAGTTRYTAGWRAVGASLSDVAAMGGTAVATVAAYGAPALEWDELEAFLDGARAVSEIVGATYAGGDLDHHEEFTVATTALGQSTTPVWRSGARPGDAVCVTGTLGRTAAALTLFEAGERERANELFRFTPRVAAGRALVDHATAMMDSSDGLARSLHQLAAASNCGFEIESPLPIDDAVHEVAADDDEARDRGLFVGEDFELVCTVPESTLSAAREATPVALTRIGTATDEGITLDGESLADRGYDHG